MSKAAKRINNQLLNPISESETAKLAKVMRVTPVSCIIVTSLGLIFNSSILMWIGAGTTLVGALSSNSLYDRIYNLFSNDKVPPMGVARSIGCGIGAVMLLLSGYFFFVGETILAFVFGGIMIVVASIAALTQLCFVSLFINLFRKEKVSCREPKMVK